MHIRKCGVGVLCVWLLIGAPACGPSPAVKEPATPLPSLDDLAPGWNELYPHGRTRCGDGSPWAFLVRPGSHNHVLVEFQRGGACWSEQTCFKDGLAFTHLTPEPDMEPGAHNVGIHDHDNPDNPFKDWTHVFVPYCTGDNHWGDSVQSYGSRKFYHRGAVNVRAALGWIYANVLTPEAVFVTGHSAGAYASITGAARLAHHYPHASIVQLGDSGVGVTAQPGLVHPEWKVRAHFPAYLTPLQQLDSIDDLYRAVAQAFPNLMLSEYTSAYDDNAAAYFDLFGGAGVRAWSRGARANLADLHATLPRFASYVAPGWMHTIENQAEFYEVRTHGVRLTDWVSQLMTRQNPASVGCGNDCGGPAFGDSGAPAEWACLDSPVTRPAPEAARIDAQFLLTDPEGTPAPGVEVKACSRSDEHCKTPVWKATTDQLGVAALSLPTGSIGFRGFLLVSGETGFFDRFYFLPPVRRWWHPWLVGSSWSYSTRAFIGELATTFGRGVHHGKGHLAVLTLDCAGSATKNVSVRVDGHAPDGYWDKDNGLGTSEGQVAYFLNLDPGDHLVSEFRNGKRIAHTSVYVGRSSLTSVYGLGPGY